MEEHILSCNDTSQEGRYGFESSNKEDELVLTVSSQETDRARLAVGNRGPTRIHVADYSLRHRRDGNAGTTILYHLRINRRPYSSSVMTAGRRELLEDGHRRRIRRGRRTFRRTKSRTEQRAE